LIPNWNDSPGRIYTEVLAAFDAALAVVIRQPDLRQRIFNANPEKLREVVAKLGASAISATQPPLGLELITDPPAAISIWP
jgi:hypothetical protein